MWEAQQGSGHNDLIGVTVYLIQVESPSQQVKDALYSLVVSVKSRLPIHEVYIDTHLHNTALKVR